jgi:hypothetical protein
VKATDLDLRGRRPILVTGMPRSGTTWVGRMLTASAEVGYLNEPFNLATSPGSVRIPTAHWYPYLTEENEQEYVPALAAVLMFDYPLLRELRRCRDRNDLLHTLRSWREFHRGRGRRPLVKEPHAVLSTTWFARRLESDVVVLVREPLAVVSSWKRLGWSFDFSNLLDQPALMRDLLAPFAEEMTDALSESWDLVARVALLWRVIYSVVARERSTNVVVVRHEDLSQDPLTEFARLYERLGLMLTDEVAEAVAASSSSENPSETSVERPHDIHLDSKANLGSWKQRLSRDEIARVVELTERTAGIFYPDLTWA